MTTEQKLERLEKNLDRLADVQNQMMDLLGLTMEGEARLATEQQRAKERWGALRRRTNASKKLLWRLATN
jgi:hypothetical protein